MKIENMTTEEKVQLCHGMGLFQTGSIKRLGIPPLKMSDGPMGVRREFQNDSWTEIGSTSDFVSYLPSNMAVAATWSLELAADFGKTLGREARGRGKDVILAPGINIIRSPLGGRNFEYMSEDPCLTSKMVVPLIKGIQENDVAACVKHFVVNNHEHNRLTISVEPDEQALHEIYLPGFKAAVTEANVLTIMSAYNRLRGEYCSENSYLLKDLLREEWGFKGIVISDWGAVHNTKEAVNAGLDIEMGVETNFNEYYLANPYLEMLKSGELSIKDLDFKVKNILSVMEELNMFSSSRKKGSFNSFENWESALKVARESVVLLKNEEKCLPLSQNLKNIVVIGENANKIHSSGGGSAEIKTLFEISPLLGLNMISGGNTNIDYFPGYTNETEVDNAVSAASQSETVILFCGLDHNFDREEFDKKDLKLPGLQNSLIEKVLAVNSNTIIVNVSGSPVEMPWIDKCKSLIQLFYAGMFSGQVIAEVVFGKVNPSGKLPLTYPKQLADSPDHYLSDFPGDKKIEYKERIFVGYRFYDTYYIEPLFHFGHGLSYSFFQYSNLHINGMKVELTIQNQSLIPGAEIIQLYISNTDSDILTPKKELKAFKKVFLEPDEVSKVSFNLCNNDFTYYCVEDKMWKLKPGKFTILCGSSSKDIRLKGDIKV